MTTAHAVFGAFSQNPSALRHLIQNQSARGKVLNMATQLRSSLRQKESNARRGGGAKYTEDDFELQSAVNWVIHECEKATRCVT